jgi:hypothetical protein
MRKRKCRIHMLLRLVVDRAANDGHHAIIAFIAILSYIRNTAGHYLSDH